jgi:hypothetical protein
VAARWEVGLEGIVPKKTGNGALPHGCGSVVETANEGELAVPCQKMRLVATRCLKSLYGPAHDLATVGLSDSFASTMSIKPARSYSAQTLSSQ